MVKSKTKIKTKIDRVEPTSEVLTGRAGLPFFVRYVEKINVSSPLERYFGSIRKHHKGIEVTEAFKQLLCFFLDGTSFHLTRFDELKKDKGYATAIETTQQDMASSHQIKRFLHAFSFQRNFLFRRLLQDLFIWRLNYEKPEVILLDLDSMVMDNDQAKKRQGVDPTYKKVKGFHPLQLKWGSFFVDAVFRGGSKHSNHGDTVVKMITHVVKRIRKGYREDVPIVITSDNGFFDQKNFQSFEELDLGYVCGGKVYEDIVCRVEDFPESRWKHFKKKINGDQYKIVSFKDKRKSWDKERKAVFTRLTHQTKQKLFPFARSNRIYYTNLGEEKEIDLRLKEAGKSKWLTDQGIVRLAHGRGDDERTHRALKDFGTEKLPCQDFQANTAFYYTMVLSFNLHETFKRDITGEVIPVGCYPTTFRRRFMDIAGKFAFTSRQIILKVTNFIWDRLKIKEIWAKANSPPVPAIV